MALRPRLSPGVPLSRCGATVAGGTPIVKPNCPAADEVGAVAYERTNCAGVPSGSEGLPLRLRLRIPQRILLRIR